LPILAVGETVVFETLAATGYVDEAFPGPSLQPGDVDGRAAMRTWMGVCGDYLFREVVRQLPRDREPTAEELETAREALSRAESIFDRQGGEGPFLVADAISLADLYRAGLSVDLAACRSYLCRYAGMPEEVRTGGLSRCCGGRRRCRSR
jgi:glutathione S-transferase